MAKINVKGLALKGVGIAAGAVAGAALNKVEFLKKQKPVVQAGIKVVLGALLPTLTKQKEGSMVANAANGLLAIGALELANSFIKQDDKKLAIAGVEGPAYFPTIGASSHVVFDEQYSRGGGSPYQEADNNEW